MTFKTKTQRRLEELEKLEKKVKKLENEVFGVDFFTLCPPRATKLRILVSALMDYLKVQYHPSYSSTIPAKMVKIKK